MCFELPRTDQAYVINLIDSPGHVDFSAEVTAALRVTDGAIVVVDSVEGVCVQTETVLRQALAERIRPVLFVNKLDRVLNELQQPPEAAAQQLEVRKKPSEDNEKKKKELTTVSCLLLQRHIAAVNGVLAAAAGVDAEFVVPALSPAASQVAFGAARDGWAFSLDTFARMYAPRWKMTADETRELLWGEHYRDPATGQWLTESISPRGTKLKSAFVQFVLEPIYLLRQLAMDRSRRAELQEKLVALGVQVTEKEFKDLDDNEPDMKKHFAFVMRRWLPAADSLLELVVTRLPSPLEAQRYRVAVLYDGPQDDECARAIAACDPNGPLMMYVSKMVPFQNVFYCFGRVFSGTIRSGVKVRVLGANYLPGVPKIDVYEDKTVKTCVLMMGRYVSPIDECPCGNTIAVTGLDKFIKKGGTLTTSASAYIIRQMKFAVAPVMQSAIRPKNAADMTNFQEGLRKLILTDGVAQAIHDAETKETVLCATGELHMEILLKDLADFAKCEVVASDPIVAYRETVTKLSSMMIMTKSPNKHNKIWLQAQPIGAELCDDIDAKRVQPMDDAKARAKLLMEKHKWDAGDARKIWCFGPDDSGPNLLVDQTKSVQNLGDIRDAVIATFQKTCHRGVLCDEELRGVRFNISNAEAHADRAHRGDSQLGPMTRHGLHASQLCAAPRLLEPVFLVSIATEFAVKNAIYGVLNKRRGLVQSEEVRPGTDMVELRAFLPVAESFHLTDELRAVTSGKAFVQMQFDHYDEVPGDPLEAGSKANLLVMQIRKRKNLKLALPTLADFLDPMALRGHV